MGRGGPNTHRLLVAAPRLDLGAELRQLLAEHRDLAPDLGDEEGLVGVAAAGAGRRRRPHAHHAVLRDRPVLDHHLLLLLQAGRAA
jgi:hypothetical protein